MPTSLERVSTFAPVIRQEERGKPQILVVDDDLSVRESLCALLESEGYVVETAADGIEAVERFHPGTTSLVLVDVSMPRRNGWATVASLRDLHSSVPILLMSARPHQQQTALAAGVEFACKPLDPASFLKQLKEMLAE